MKINSNLSNVTCCWICTFRTDMYNIILILPCILPVSLETLNTFLSFIYSPYSALNLSPSLLSFWIWNKMNRNIGFPSISLFAPSLFGCLSMPFYLFLEQNKITYFEMKLTEKSILIWLKYEKVTEITLHSHKIQVCHRVRRQLALETQLLFLLSILLPFAHISFALALLHSQLFERESAYLLIRFLDYHYSSSWPKRNLFFHKRLRGVKKNAHWHRECRLN